MGSALLRHSSLLCSPLSNTKSTTTTTLSSPLRSLFLKSRTRFLNPLTSSSSPSSPSSSRSSLYTKANENDKVGDSNGSPAPELCLYNTMSRAKELFTPRVAGRVGMYVCGVTAYDFSHIGHARVYVTFDVLYRYLQHLNYEVFYVRNFTDVDDKIIARANELEEDPLSLSNCFCDEFHVDMADLHCLPPSVEPHVSEHMDQIIDMIKQVIDLYHPLALRLFLIGTHYRSPINYSNAQLETASDRLYYIFQSLHDCEEIFRQNSERNLEDSAPPEDTLDCIARFHSEFENSLSDDLHTPVALAALSEPLRIINDLLHTHKGKKQQKRIESIFAIEKEIMSSLTVLGLTPSSNNDVLLQLREKALKRAGLTEEVLQKIEDMETRKELAAVGIVLMDGPERNAMETGHSS